MKRDTYYATRQFQDIREMLDASARDFAALPAFRLKQHTGGLTDISYADFTEKVRAFATGLLDLGLEGKRIAVIGENRYEWCMTYLSVVNAVGIIVPLDRELPLDEIENLLMRSEAAAIVFSGKVSREITQLKDRGVSLPCCICMDTPEPETGFLSMADILHRGELLRASGNRNYEHAPLNPDDMRILLFTSGTTDLAKGVMLSHRNIAFNILATVKILKINAGDVVLSILPMHHTYECTCGFMLMIAHGVTVSFCEGLKHISRNIREYRPTVLLLVPLILENMHKRVWESASKDGLTEKLRFGMKLSAFLLKFGIDIRKKVFSKIHDNLGGRLRLIISGAAAINPDVSRELRAFGFNIRQGYGLTECAPIVCVNGDVNFKDASIGRALPGMEVVIDQPDADGVGELITRSPSVMLGYFNNPEATERVLKDGWFHTGDLGYKDTDGFFYITGRKKNVIVTKNGKNIYPEEVEAYLNKSAYIVESVVMGVLDESTGETDVIAHIVPDTDALCLALKTSTPPPDDIRRLIGLEIREVNHHMPLYKRVVRFEIRNEEFAKTTTKKIKRFEV